MNKIRLIVIPSLIIVIIFISILIADISRPSIVAPQNSPTDTRPSQHEPTVFPKAPLISSFEGTEYNLRIGGSGQENIVDVLYSDRDIYVIGHSNSMDTDFDGMDSGYFVSHVRSSMLYKIIPIEGEYLSSKLHPYGLTVLSILQSGISAVTYSHTLNKIGECTIHTSSTVTNMLTYYNADKLHCIARIEGAIVSFSLNRNTYKVSEHTVMTEGDGNLLEILPSIEGYNLIYVDEDVTRILSYDSNMTPIGTTRLCDIKLNEIIPIIHDDTLRYMGISTIDGLNLTIYTTKGEQKESIRLSECSDYCYIPTQNGCIVFDLTSSKVYGFDGNLSELSALNGTTKLYGYTYTPYGYALAVKNISYNLLIVNMSNTLKILGSTRLDSSLTPCHLVYTDTVTVIARIDGITHTNYTEDDISVIGIS